MSIIGPLQDVQGPPMCNCYKLNRIHIIVVPPMNDKIDTMINDYYFVSHVCPQRKSQEVSACNFEPGSDYRAFTFRGAFMHPNAE